MLLVVATVTVAVVTALSMVNWLMKKDDGTKEMQEIVDAIRKGSEGFFKTQYGTIFRLTFVVGGAIFVGYLFRPSGAGHTMSTVSLATVTACTFMFGAFCSAMSGYIGLYICVRANARVASAARTSFRSCMQVALIAGAIPALIVVSLVVLGVAFLYAVTETYIVGEVGAQEKPEEIPLLMVGFGFGASFVALFAQLGGGIFTKAADVGADLVGKVESGLDEDDPRNPAVVADLVGDNVGDCAGRGADLFESIAAEIIAAMVLGGTMAKKANLPAAGFVMFPLVVHACDLVVSSIGIAYAFNLPESSFASRQVGCNSIHPMSMLHPTPSLTDLHALRSAPPPSTLSLSNDPLSIHRPSLYQTTLSLSATGYSEERILRRDGLCGYTLLHHMPDAATGQLHQFILLPPPPPPPPPPSTTPTVPVQLWFLLPVFCRCPAPPLGTTSSRADFSA
jgi:hypothetical protein